MSQEDYVREHARANRLEVELAVVRNEKEALQRVVRTQAEQTDLLRRRRDETYASIRKERIEVIVKTIKQHTFVPANLAELINDALEAAHVLDHDGPRQIWMKNIATELNVSIDSLDEGDAFATLHSSASIHRKTMKEALLRIQSANSWIKKYGNDCGSTSDTLDRILHGQCTCHAHDYAPDLCPRPGDKPHPDPYSPVSSPIPSPAFIVVPNGEGP